MKVLLDSCVWGPAAETVREAGHEVVWAGDWERDPGDDEILSRAAREGRVLVTLDKDFGELAIVHGAPHRGIFRLVGFSARDQGKVIVDVLDRYGQELSDGGLVTVEPGRARIRPADR